MTLICANIKEIWSLLICSKPIISCRNTIEKIHTMNKQLIIHTIRYSCNLNTKTFWGDISLFLAMWTVSGIFAILKVYVVYVVVNYMNLITSFYDWSLIKTIVNFMAIKYRIYGDFGSTPSVERFFCE